MADALWQLDEILAATGGTLEGGNGRGFSSVSIDSRALLPGALFVAIKGERRDGHDFVAQALDAGAAGAVISEPVDLESHVGPLIRTGDTLEALNVLGRAARGRADATVIAVTGSVGKTGTKEALRHALSLSGPTHVSEKSYNNQWGVPLSLANMPQATRFGVFEAGMNHAGEIAALADIIQPHIAIITTVEPVHLKFFGSLEAIAEAKAEIFLRFVAGGAAILNRDNPYFELLRSRALKCGAGTILDFGTHAEAFARLIHVTLEADGSDAVAIIGRQIVRYRVGAPGRHQVLNSLAVLAAVYAAGADVSAAAQSLGSHQAQKGRGERIEIELAGGAVAIIDESYNANPASMRAALEAMAHVPREVFPRRIAVLGDMLELGDEGACLHRSLVVPVDAAGIDVVFACGPLMEGLYEELPHGRRGAYAKTSVELEPMLLDAVAPGDVVMIKGSLGSRMAPLLKALRENLNPVCGNDKPAQKCADK